MSEIIEYIDPNLLKPDPNQPRQTWTEKDLEELKELAETFKTCGIIHPIEVDENNVIILGERRWRASKIAGLNKVPIRRQTGLSYSKRFERQLVDDAHRRDLNPLDRAWAYATAVVNINTGKNYTIKQVKEMDRDRLVNLLTYSKVLSGKEGGKGLGGGQSGQAELSRRIGVPQRTIGYYLSLLKAEPKTLKVAEEEWKKPPKERKFQPRHLVEASRLQDKELKKEFEKAIVEGKYGKSDDVREVVTFINKHGTELEPEIKRKLVNKEIEPKSVDLAKFAEGISKGEELLSEEDKRLLEGKQPTRVQPPIKEPVLPETKYLTLELPYSLYEQYQKLAEKKEETIEALCLRALEEWMDLYFLSSKEADDV